MKKEIEYRAIVDKTKEFSLTASLIDSATILHDTKGLPKQIIFENQRYDVKIEATQDSVYTVKVDGISFEVEIKRPIHILVDELGFNKPKIRSEQIVLSPMPGHILTINKDVGQKVARGEKILTLEAMKMENTIQSPQDGIVKEIFVKQGETVNKGQKLMEIR
ncbi:MAG: biotin/lipoyl-binding protein [Saprospiraceae bacterium]|nr:biotin/lipoyl-binding protein [Saprospiraceae bacterium]